MRINRSIQLSPMNGTVHLYWRCHNKEYYLQNNKFKEVYLDCLQKGLEHRPLFLTHKLKENCRIHAFCAMGNHFYQITSYMNGSHHLSLFMRHAHALFGIRYNRAKKRSGKVAEGRPKTPLIQNQTHEMRVHFYVEANPIRAGFRTIENLKDYHYSSYGFYAYGKKTKHTHLLTIPQWYLSLGKNVRERQAKYRKLFREYLGVYHSSSSHRFKKAFIGDIEWVIQMLGLVGELFRLTKIERSNDKLNAVNTT